MVQRVGRTVVDVAVDGTDNRGAALGQTRQIGGHFVPCS